MDTAQAPRPRRSVSPETLGSLVLALLVVRGLDAFGSGSHNVALPVQPLVPDACTANVKVPGAVGVPDSMPSALRRRPDGGVPLKMLKV